MGAPISVYCIGPRADVIDSEDRWASVTGLAPDGALLIRPDDFVGWRADNLPAHPGNEPSSTLSHPVPELTHQGSRQAGSIHRHRRSESNGAVQLH